MRGETGDWVAKAEDDFSVAIQLAASNQPSYHAISFHAQQSAEKYLKAFLVEHNMPFPKTHILVDLLVLCLPIGSGFQALRQDVEDLTVYGVRVRYPGFSATQSAAEEALAAAARVRTFVRGEPGLDPAPPRTAADPVDTEPESPT